MWLENTNILFSIIFLSVVIILSIFSVLIYYFYNKLSQTIEEKITIEKHNVLLNSENKYLKQLNKDLEDNLENKNKSLKVEFENYVNQIFNKESSLTEKNVVNILKPFKDKIAEFQDKVDKIYHSESREIFSLKNEINKLLVNNANMVKETENLTNALKGNVKAQGVWGEIILEKILESSGLRAGHEYITQGKNLHLNSDDNKVQKPDVIINLPDNKHLIIDAKVSLTHYEQYISILNNQSDNIELDNSGVNNIESDSKKYLDLFIKSIQNHINILSSKNYQYNDKLLTPDFVLLFFPIEGAFSLALQTMPDLFTKAWHNKIIIVSPTTLFATLKTIASIWLFEKQNKNAMNIAKEAGLLYDKFVLFVDDINKIGLALNKADESYNAALNKLTQGRGNIIAKAEKIKLLGAKAKKNLDKNNLDQNNLDNNKITQELDEDSSINSSSSTDNNNNAEMELAND